MLTTRADKVAEISALAERFSRAKATFLVDFKGMTVEQVTNLRQKLVPTDSEMKVVRNTLALRALADYERERSALTDSLVGNNALVFAYADVTVTAKTISDFAKDVEVMQIKGGVVDGSAVNAAGVKALASLPGKDVLRAQLLGVFQAPMGTFVRTLNAVPSGFARVLNARKESLEKGA